MTLHRHLLLILALLCTTTAQATGNNWIDAISLTYGEDNESQEVKLYRLGLQNKWDHTWQNGGAWYVGGYWDAELAYLESDISDSDNDELYDLGLTPVFRMQRDASLSKGITPYAEAGIGPHLISETSLGSKRFSTAFQLGGLVGFGLGFGEKGQYEISYRFQHLSNVEIKKPNDGLNLHLLRLGYSFQ